MATLKNWKARRSGGRITVTGENEEGKLAKITGVDTIDPPQFPSDQHVLATDKDGVVHTLKF